MTKEETFEANIKWGVANDDIDPEQLPSEFVEAKSLWEAKDERAFVLVSKFIRCVFIPDNIFGDISEILDLDDEVEAETIVVTGLDFSKSNLPRVCAYAHLKLSVVDGFGQSEIEEWQDDNDMLDVCISFEWNLPDLSDDDLDIYSWDHEGLGFAILE